jgi:glycosyltransferase involved in cell wall biosynthesis
VKVAVEASVLARRRKTGVDYYTRGLLRALVDEMRDAEFALLHFGRPGADLGVAGRNVRTRAVPMHPRLYRALVKRFVPPPLDVIARTRAHVYLFTDFVCFPLRHPARRLVIVYDLSFVLHPEFVARGNRTYLAKGVRRSVEVADRVITISETVRDEIVAHYGVEPHRLAVAPPGVDAGFFSRRPDDEVERVRRAHGIERPYVLFQGTLEPRKNLDGLLDAWELLPEPLRREHALVLSGGKGWLDRPLLRRVETLGRRGLPIVRTGWIPEADLPALYTGARAFVFPSHYEGFGMPVLEAMACGTPVIASRVASIPEVVGDAGLLIDPRAPESITAALETLLFDSALVERLRARARARARDFEWQRTGRLVAGVLRELAG